MSFRQLPLFEETALAKPAKSKRVVVGLAKPKNAATGRLGAAKAASQGCAACPSAKTPGVHRIKGKIRGRDILVFAQSPGPEENDHDPPMELVGPSGRWWWKELKRIGIERKNVDVQNVMRCFPADWEEGTYNTYLKMRSPTPLEIKCCSVYTEDALAESKAKQILVLGQVAAKAVLKTRSLPASKTFWSDELNARVYLLDHPSFFIRGYGEGARLEAFRSLLDRVAQDRKTLARRGATVSDQFAYIRSQDYQLVLDEGRAEEAEKVIRRYAGKGFFIGVDIESDDFKDGYHTFACGFCPKKGLTYVFVFRHRDQKKLDGEKVLTVARRLLEDEAVPKSFQYGCSDCSTLKNCDGIEVKGYRHDTNLSEFLVHSDDKAYGLDAIAERKYVEFSGYKLIRVKEPIEAAAKKWVAENPGKNLPKVLADGPLDAQDKWLEANHELHLKYLSLETLRLYNGADCDLTKRIELANRKKLPEALVRLYIDLNYLLREMEPNGPLFDYEQSAKLNELYPRWEKKLKARLCKAVGDKNFNPGSPQQVYTALYETLGLEYPFEGKPNTRKGVLLTLARTSKFPGMVLEYRSVARMASTGESYKACADANEGSLRTRWWSTGARTGRLSSGGSRDKSRKVVNLQNIKKDAQVKNMCVADIRWRKAYEAFQEIASKGGSDTKLASRFEAWVQSLVKR